MSLSQPLMTSDKLLQPGDLYILHLETVAGPKSHKCNFLHNVALDIPQGLQTLSFNFDLPYMLKLCHNFQFYLLR